MRGTVNMVSRVVALVLAFVMGFLIMACFVVGGGYLAFTKVSVGMLESIGIIPIELNDHFEEDAEVPVEKLTIAGLVNELVFLLKDKSKFTINTMTERYGLKFAEKIPDYVTDEFRNMPITELMQKSTLKRFAAETLIGDIYNYEKVENPDYDPDAGNGFQYTWYDGDRRIEGFNELICSITVEELLFGDPTDFISDFIIADALSLKKVEGLKYYLLVGEERVLIENMENPISVWKDSHGVPASGIINALAEYKVSELSTDLDTLTVGEITSLVRYNEKWYGWRYEAENNCVVLEERDGLTIDFADIQIKDISNGNLSDKTKEIKLSTVLGYTMGDDGNWYDGNGQQVTGVMAAIADSTVGGLDTHIGEMYIGDVAGYTKAGDEWLDTSGDKSEPATGILAAIADLTVDDVTDEEKLSEAIQNVSVADIMGYDKGADGNWYHGTEKVTGFMAVIAGTPIREVSNEIDTTPMGDFIGYDYYLDPNDGETRIYIDDNGEDVHVLMQKIASAKLPELDTIVDTLTVEDLIPEEDRAQGFIKLVAPETTLEEIPFEVNRIFDETPVYKYVDAGIIEVDAEHAPFYREDTELGDMTFKELLQHIGDLTLLTN